jgi:DNA-binding IclR family transcriptional regulator
MTEGSDPATLVREALARSAAPASAAEIAAATGLTENTVRRTLGRLVAIREARRAGGGRFTAARAR